MAKRLHGIDGKIEKSSARPSLRSQLRDDCYQFQPSANEPDVNLRRKHAASTSNGRRIMTIRSFTVAIGDIILGLSFAAGTAEAQSSNAMKKTDTMKMDTMKKDTMKTDSMKMAGNKTDCMHKAGMEKDSMKKSNMMKKCDAMK